MVLLTLTLPYPPSVNKIWRAVNGRNILSKTGRLYRLAVKSVAAKARANDAIPKTPIKGDLVCTLEVHPPDNRRRDLDNIAKAVLDGLTHAKVWLDDSQVAEEHKYRMAPVPNGKVVVTVGRLKRHDYARPCGEVGAEARRIFGFSPDPRWIRTICCTTGRGKRHVYNRRHG